MGWRCVWVRRHLALYVGEDLSDLGELEVIRRLLARVPTGELIVPPGDDAALVPTTSETLATADLLVEGRHFDFAFSSPGDVGFNWRNGMITRLAGTRASSRAHAAARTRSSRRTGGRRSVPAA